MARPDHVATAETDRDLLIRAVRSAGDVALEWYRPGEKTSARVTRKDDGSVVTEADLAVNAALKKTLTDARPDYGWLSEEEPESVAEAAARSACGRSFVVDPIDGTRSFVDGQDLFCVSVAVVCNGAPSAGAVFVPAQGRCFAAAVGAGATCDGAPLALRSGPAATPPRVLIGNRDLRPAAWAGGPPPKMAQGYLPPIAHRLCKAAVEDWDGLVSLKQTHEWDVAAGVLIAREAGFTCSDRHGADLAFNQPRPQVAGVLVARPDLHAALLKLRPRAPA